MTCNCVQMITFYSTSQEELISAKIKNLHPLEFNVLRFRWKINFNFRFSDGCEHIKMKPEIQINWVKKVKRQWHRITLAPTVAHLCSFYRQLINRKNIETKNRKLVCDSRKKTFSTFRITTVVCIPKPLTKPKINWKVNWNCIVSFRFHFFFVYII